MKPILYAGISIAIVFGLAMFALLLFIATGIAFGTVEIEAEGSCNTGDVMLDIESNNFIQEKPCLSSRTSQDEDGNWKTTYIPDPSEPNMTCYKTDLMLDHIDLQGIKNLNCQGKVKTKMPFIMSMFLGGLD